MGRYSFSGHESFQCKALWLKKGYDFIKAGQHFSDVDAVAKLGVGKNMVSSIKFWLRSFGLIHHDQLTPIAEYLFDSSIGVDPYAEDLNTLWILHFLLVSSAEASIYKLLFVDYKREKKDFTKNELQSFVSRKCSARGFRNAYNENTVRKDIGVLLKNYIAPSDLKKIEDYSSLLISLELLYSKDSELYSFRNVKAEDLASEVVLFAIIRMKGHDFTVSFDMLQDLSLILGLTMVSLIEIVRKLENEFPDTLVFSDNSGVKNVQFLRNIDEYEALNHYYLSR